MHLERDIIGLLKAEKAKMGVAVLENPPPDYSSLMQVVGMYKGLQQSIEIIEQMMRDELEDD